jgi:hypothetical protein
VSYTLETEQERCDDVVASLAVALDGFVCRPDGAVDYLDKYPLDGFDFPAWTERVGALVMGRTTYEQAVSWGWTWGDRPTLVLTSATDLAVAEGADVTFRAATTAEAIAEFSAIPEAIGEGVPLFTEPFSGPMRPLAAVPFANGAVRLVYDTCPAGTHD